MPDSYKSLPILWVAMLNAVLVLAGVTFSGVVPPTGEGGLPALVLVLPAGMSGALSVVGVRLFMPTIPAQSAYIVRFATAESVAVFGLVAHVLGGPLPLVVGFFVVSLTLLVVARPTEDGFTEWEMRRGG